MTYLGLAAVVTVPAILLAVLAGRRRGATWWRTTVITLVGLLVLTIVFDSLMIQADLFRYDESHLTGIRLLLAPVEDLAWPLVSVLLLPALWELLAPRPTKEATRP